MIKTPRESIHVPIGFGRNSSAASLHSMAPLPRNHYNYRLSPSPSTNIHYAPIQAKRYSVLERPTKKNVAEAKVIARPFNSNTGNAVKRTLTPKKRPT